LRLDGRSTASTRTRVHGCSRTERGDDSRGRLPSGCAHCTLDLREPVLCNLLARCPSSLPLSDKVSWRSCALPELRWRRENREGRRGPSQPFPRGSCATDDSARGAGEVGKLDGDDDGDDDDDDDDDDDGGDDDDDDDDDDGDDGDDDDGDGGGGNVQNDFKRRRMIMIRRRHSDRAVACSQASERFEGPAPSAVVR
jgi:hypothetical protein